MTIWEQIKDRVTVAELAAEAGVQTGRGKATCPFCHYEKSPSFHADTEWYRCHHCGKKGDVFTFIADLQGTDTWGAAKILAQRLGIDCRPAQEDLARESKSEIYKRFADQYKALPEAAVEYLTARGLRPEFIEKKGIGYIPQDAQDEKEPLLREAGIPALLRGRILVPFWQGRQIVYFTGRTIGAPPAGEPKFKNQRGPKTTIGTMRGPELWITEGIFDQLLAEQAGANCIGIAGSGGEIKLHPGIKQVTLAFDNDEAGEAFTEKHGLALYRQGAQVQIAKLPAGVKDLADYLQAGRPLGELETETIKDRYMRRLAADPKNKDLKRTFYEILARMDAIDKEQEIKALGKLWGVPVPIVRQDLADYTKEEIEGTFSTEDGLAFSMPEGYAMGPGGIFAGRLQVSTAPIFVTKIGINSRTGEEYVEYRYGLNGTTRSKYSPRLEIARSNDFINHAAAGAPVNSANVIPLIKFLDAWCARNREKFGTFEAVSQLGWLDNGQDFVLPDRVLPSNAHVHYVGDLPKTAYKAKGTLQEWTATIRRLKGLPNGHVVRFLVYAGFASAILEPLNLRPFIVHLHGDTSVGKTTALRIVASIYGNPVEGQAMIRWNNTENFILRYMETLHNIPLVIDELGGEARKTFDKIIFQMEGGVSKGKASRTDANAVAKQRTFRLGVFSSGEAPILSERSLGGAVIRAWEFSGQPFGERNAELITQVDRGIQQNHGVALEHFLLNFHASRAALNEPHTFYTPQPGEAMTNVEERMLKLLDWIYKIGELADAAFALEFPVEDDMRRVFEILRVPAGEKTRTVEKLVDRIRDHYSMNQGNFPAVDFNRSENKNKVHYEGGKRPPVIYGYRFDGTDLGIIKSHFIELMDEYRDSFNGGQAAINRLAEAGIIRKPREKRRIDGTEVHLVYFPGFFTAEDEEQGEAF